MKNSGVTLIELLIVVSIIGILIVALGFSYEGWLGNYRIESQTKELYFDLTDARTRAMTRHRIHWVILKTNQYTIIEDTNDNATLDSVPDVDNYIDEFKAKNGYKNYEYDYDLTVIGIGSMPQTITFNTRGIISWVPAVTEMTFRFINTRDPDFDCIVIEQSRIWMGEYNTDINVCERR